MNNNNEETFESPTKPIYHDELDIEEPEEIDNNQNDGGESHQEEQDISNETPGLEANEDNIPDEDRPIFSQKNWLRFKIFLVVFGLIANIAVRFSLPTDRVDCILDKTHIWLAPLNTFLHENKNFAFYTKFFFTILVDLNIVSGMVHWVFISKRWQLIFDLAVFFIVRFFCTHLIAYRNADGNLWPDNNFISISGTKMEDQQYQVSAYSGVLLILVLYWIQHSRRRLVNLKKEVGL